MNVYQFSHRSASSLPIAEELTFLQEHTGQDETTILIHAYILALKRSTVNMWSNCLLRARSRAKKQWRFWGKNE